MTNNDHRCPCCLRIDTSRDRCDGSRRRSGELEFYRREGEEVPRARRRPDAEGAANHEEAAESAGSAWRARPEAPPPTVRVRGAAARKAAAAVPVQRDRELSPQD